MARSCLLRARTSFVLEDATTVPPPQDSKHLLFGPAPPLLLAARPITRHETQLHAVGEVAEAEKGGGDYIPKEMQELASSYWQEPSANLKISILKMLTQGFNVRLDKQDLLIHF